MRETIGERTRERESPACVGRVTVTIAPGQLLSHGARRVRLNEHEKRDFVAFRYFYFINSLAGLGAVCTYMITHKDCGNTRDETVICGNQRGRTRKDNATVVS